MRRGKRALAALIFVGGAGSIGVLAATVLWAVPPSVRFVLPNQFRGGFVILKDPAALDRVESGYRSTTVKVPENGELRVRSDAFLRRYSGWSASYASGAALPLDYELLGRAEERTGQVALWAHGYGYGSAHGPRYDFFVGTRAEFEEFDFEYFKPGVGGVE
jgi:hypothetical protein